MHVEWNDKAALKSIIESLDDVLNRGAEMVLSDAKTMVPVDTGTLKSEIEIKKSRFKDGGYIIQAQGPGNYTKYYAAMVEFGTIGQKRPRRRPHEMDAQPYLRPAVKRNRETVSAMIREALNKI